MEASKQIASGDNVTPAVSSVAEIAVENAEILEGYKVIRRNGTVVGFDRQKIIVALT